MKKHQAENLIVPVLLGSTFLAGLTLTLPSVSASTDIVTDVAITVPASCALSSSVTTEHADEVNNGTYQADIGTTRLKATCNDGDGFAIYAIGFSGDEYGNTKLLSTLDSSHDIITGTATSAGTPDVSNWAMKLTAVSGTYTPNILSDTSGSFSAYHVVPATYTKVASFASTTDNSVGASIDTTYSAYISATQPADTYSGKVKYTMVHPASEPAPYTGETTESGKICYYSGVTDSEGTMGCQDVASSVTLLASNFSRTGYGFAGWTDKFDYATNNTAKYYGPNETISIPDTSIYTGEGKGLSLYAVWIKSQGSLQDSTKVAELCGTTGANPTTGSLTQAPIDGTANKSSVSALTDERDNQTYAIAKLADDNCWMIENLRLESTATANTSGSLAQGYNSSFKGLATAESANFTDSTTANSLYTTESNIDGKNTISGGYQDYRFPRYNNNNTSARATNATGTGNTYSYGNYYTWTAAIADTTDYSSGDHGTTSICPTGWRLPQGNTTSAGFGKLDVDMGGTGAYQSTSEASLRWRKFPLNFVYSGYVYSGSVGNRGSNGYYWSSTAYSSSYAYYLYLYSSSVSPGTDYGNNRNYKYYGRSIRCLAVPSV